jgi:hypothetical protein
MENLKEIQINPEKSSICVNFWVLLLGIQTEV